VIVALALLLRSLDQTAPADTISLVPGLTITRSAVIRPGRYRLQPPAGDSVVIRIKGSAVTLDFQLASLVGTGPDALPDQAGGIGILVEGGRDVTIRRARISGFRVGILARKTRGLRLLDNDVSYNWKPRLWSGPGHESLVDWLTYHHNENDEWLRYGAGIYLAGVTGGLVRGNTATQGMNGLLLVRSDSLEIRDNDFSFLSGVGIGLYRSSWNRIVHNRAAYCVRGYSHGAYNRGQDSAALLLYEQSSHNVIAYNSMTHGGDGLFLWAGQTTMDSGTGGANDNLIFANDFSFAVTNGMEATFSRNRLIGNLVEGAHYGLWGGYSYQSEIRGNRLVGNTVGIAIEHGQENRILGNTFERDLTAIHLWSNPVEPSDWGYPKQRDTRSRDYRIEGNAFRHNGTALRIENTQRVAALGNRTLDVDTVLATKGDTAGFRMMPSKETSRSKLRRWGPDPTDPAAPPTATGPRRHFPGALGGRETILVDEWGPYDWRAPRLWPARLADSAAIGAPTPFVVLGPAGRWRLVRLRGATIDDSAGSVGDTVTITPTRATPVDWELELEYWGGPVVAPNGTVTAAGQPYRFRAERFRVPIDWTVSVFPFDSGSDPRSSSVGFETALGRPPALVRRDSLLDYQWSRSRLPGFPLERFGVVAKGEVELPAGDYQLITISDDGIRVWIDGTLVIDRWTPHESMVDRAPISPGAHRIRIEYYQVDGWLELRAEIRKRPPPS
jgi:parallel beta-helix repeat protein